LVEPTGIERVTSTIPPCLEIGFPGGALDLTKENLDKESLALQDRRDY